MVSLMVNHGLYGSSVALVCFRRAKLTTESTFLKSLQLCSILKIGWMQRGCFVYTGRNMYSVLIHAHIRNLFL